jgi:hypothetical protein
LVSGDPAGKKLLRQFADFRALLKDRLSSFVESGNLLFGVEAKPELRTLAAYQEWDLYTYVAQFILQLELVVYPKPGV